MKQNKLKEFIKKLVKEYTGTGASGGNAGDGNNITSPRVGGIFDTDQQELENYIFKNVYGGDGGHYVHEPATRGTLTRDPRGGMFELKKTIKKIIDEIKEEDLGEQAYGSATLTTQGQYNSRFTKTGKPPGIMEDDPEEIKEQVSQAAQKTYEAGLKRLQKSVLRYQIRWIEKQRADAISQAASAASESGKGFDDQIAALKDQIVAIDNPEQAGEQNEGLLKEYLNKRKNTNLMTYMDSYKRGILLEGTVKKIFKKFKKGNSNEDVISSYAKEGVKIPEQFISKIRKHYESLQKLKLELDLAEQESKDVIIIPTKAEDPILFNLEPEEPKELSTRLFKEQKTKEYAIPPEIEDALVNTLKLNPLIRFVKNLKAVNSVPPSYRIFLLNDQDFFIFYEEDGLMAKIGIDEYYLNHYQEVNYAIKHINKLLIQPKMRSGDSEEEDTELLDKPADKAPAGPTSPPSPPSPSPEDEE